MAGTTRTAIAQMRVLRTTGNGRGQPPSSPRHEARKGHASRKKRREALGFVAPTVVAILVTFVWPLARVVRLSLQGESGVTLEHFSLTLSDTRVHAALWTSIRYTGYVVVGSIVVGMGAALLLNRELRSRGLLRALFIMPWAMPFVATALVWRWMLDSQYGVITYLFQQVGVRLPPMFDSWIALGTVSGIEIWKSFPLAAIMFLGGMQAIPRELYEAAAIDGANAWKTFRNVTLPGLRHVVNVTALLLTLWTFGRAFVIIYLTTGGGPAGTTETAVLLTYLQGFGRFDLSGSAALGIIVLALSMLLTLVYARVAKEDQ